MYISRFNSVKLPIKVHSFKGQAEEVALIDSGATESFVDFKTVARLRLGTKRLPQKRPIRNIDGTSNQSGDITHYCDLLVSRGDKKEKTRFYVTNLGNDRFILGYPWLAEFNPQIDWPSATMIGDPIKMETLLRHRLSKRVEDARARRTEITNTEFIRAAREEVITQLEDGDELYMAIKYVNGETLKIRKTTLAQQMAEKAYDPAKVNSEQTIPVVFRRHWRVFSEQEARQLPPHRPWDHKIKLKPDAPDVINSKVYPLSKDEQKVLDEYLDDNLEKGYITASSSPYGSPTFTVKKKDGTLRIVHDYRRLNEYTVMDVTPLPRIQSILEELRGKTLFSKFDIRAGYNNIRIASEDTYKTGFKTSKGLFEWIVMPFGLCNAPATFTRMGNDILRPLYAKYPQKFRHYMDDCIVMTGPGEEALHRQICRDYFDILEKHSLYLKPAKCEFFKKEIDYLGIRVKNGELMIDPAKIAGITEWPTTLNTVKEVRSTLGLLGYHRQWIPNFARIAKPLTDLLQKGREFAWDAACESAVRTLIGLVTSEPVIVPPDTEQQFILYVDASQFATGAILYQADKARSDKRGKPLLRPLGFNSQTFNKTEQNYPIYDRELLAVIRGLRCWKHLLRNTVYPVLVITDHANLQYYREPQKIGPRVNGYLADLADYNIQLVYRPGATNRADALSRRPDAVPVEESDLVLVLPDHLFVNPEAPATKFQTTRTDPDAYESDTTLVESDSDTDVASDSESEGENPKVIRARATSLSTGRVSAYELDTRIMDIQKIEARTLRRWRISHGLRQCGTLWCKDGAVAVVGNDTLKRGVISLFHDSTTAGHPGIAKTLAMVSRFYWWPGIKDFVTEYVKGCHICQMTKTNTHPTRPALSPITTDPTARPFEVISLDFIVKLPLSNGFDTILTITDHDCSKAAIFIPCNETIDAPGVAQLYAANVFPHYGIPTRVISDRDPRFASNFSRELCNILKIAQNVSSAYHPQTDGQSERTNQSLEQYLRIYCGTRQEQWADWLPLAQYTRNSWPNATTKKAPFELILGYIPLAHQPTREADVPDINQRLKHVDQARQEAQESIKKAQETMVKGTKFKGFEEGDKVWLEGTNIKRPYDSKKLSPKRYGPFEVAARISQVAYQLVLPETWEIHNVFHASLLTPFKETEEYGTAFIEPPPEVIEGEEEYEVEQILGKRYFGRGRKLQYLVRWKGYAPAHDQWVKHDELHADELVKEFEARQIPERNPRRSIRTPRRKPTTVIRSLSLLPIGQDSLSQMSNNASATNISPIPKATSPFPTSPQPTTALTVVNIGGGASPISDEPIIQARTTSTSPAPLPVKPRPESAGHLSDRADRPISRLLTSTGTVDEREKLSRLYILWQRAHALSEYRTVNRHYPPGFDRPGVVQAFPVLKALSLKPTPPLALSDVMKDSQIEGKLDVRLWDALERALESISPYLPGSEPDRHPFLRHTSDDDKAEEPTDVSDNVVKQESGGDSRYPGHKLADDSRNVLKEQADSRPAVTEALIRQSVHIEYGDNLMPVVSDKVLGKRRMRISPTPTAGEPQNPIDLSQSDKEDSDSENDAEHPGAGWIRYDAKNPEHYPVHIEYSDHILSVARYIRFVFDGENTILQGTEGKGDPIYQKDLYARVPSDLGRPNITNDKDIRDDHLFVLHPESELRELVDRAVHTQTDPGLMADIVRYRAQVTRQSTYTARKLALERDMRLNDDALASTKRRLIHARACTRVFNAVYSEAPVEPRAHPTYVNPVRGAQGPPDRPPLRRMQTPPETDAYSPYTRPKLAKPLFCYECFQTQPNHLPKDCPDYGQCFFCASTQHESMTCVAPHVRCEEFACIVPSWHPGHHSLCSAKAVARLLRLRRDWPIEALRAWDTAVPTHLTTLPSSPADDDFFMEL